MLMFLFARKYRGGQKKDAFRYCVITLLYIMLLRWVLVGILLVLLLIQIGVI